MFCFRSWPIEMDSEDVCTKCGRLERNCECPSCWKCQFFGITCIDCCANCSWFGAPCKNCVLFYGKEHPSFTLYQSADATRKIHACASCGHAGGTTAIGCKLFGDFPDVSSRCQAPKCLRAFEPIIATLYEYRRRCEARYGEAAPRPAPTSHPHVVSKVLSLTYERAPISVTLNL